MKLVRLIKMCLNETYSKVRIGKHISDIVHKVNNYVTKQNKQTPWSESASELYRPSNRRLSAK
jgi:methionine aminopeptidase